MTEAGRLTRDAALTAVEALVGAVAVSPLRLPAAVARGHRLRSADQAELVGEIAHADYLVGWKPSVKLVPVVPPERRVRMRFAAA